MIKSPCKNCEKHKEEFPECFKACEIIKRVQRKDGHSILEIRTNDNYTLVEDHGFGNNNRNKSKYPALS